MPWSVEDALVLWVRPALWRAAATSLCPQLAFLSEVKQRSRRESVRLFRTKLSCGEALLSTELPVTLTVRVSPTYALLLTPPRR